MKMASRGFLLIDAVIAATVLAIAVGAVAGAMTAQEAAKERALARASAARCFDEALVEVAVEPQKRSGACGDIAWSISDEPAGPMWTALQEKSHVLSVPFPKR